MLKKISEVAEQAATSASRRQFLGRLGRGAMAAAAALAGLLAASSAAQAARGQQVCGSSSASECLGKKQNAKCSYVDREGTRYVGRCQGAPLCYCDARPIGR